MTFYERNLGLRARSGDPRRLTTSRSHHHLLRCPTVNCGQSREIRRTISRTMHACVTLSRSALSSALTASLSTSRSHKQARALGSERARWYYILRRSNTRDRLKRGFRPRALSLPRAALRRARMSDSRYGVLLRPSSEFRAFSAKIGNLSLYLIT